MTKKELAVISIVAILLLGGSCFPNEPVQALEPKTTLAPTAAENPSIATASEPAENSVPIVSPAQTAVNATISQDKIPVFFDIRGDSVQLTKNERESIDKWKIEIMQEAKDHPDTVFLNGNTREKQVALTFDDGPDPVITPKILGILKNYNVHANFFFIGQNAQQYPAVVKRAFDEGNLVLNHSYDHPVFYHQSREFINSELTKTDNILKGIIGKVPALVRPPYGIVTENVLSEANSRGYKLIIWSIDTFDWSQKDKSHISSNILNNVRPGEIILMHSNGDKQATADALPDIIEGLEKMGYNIVTLDSLLDVNAYK